MTRTDSSVAEPPSPVNPAVIRFGRLSPLAAVGLRAEACLHIRRPYVACRRCQTACPHGCLKLGDGGLELDATQCVGCGLCAAYCPTGALAVDGFAFDGVAPGQPLTIACRKSARGDRATRVPCLGGIGVTTWLTLTLRAAGARIRVLDDGACSTCPTARGQGNPGQDFLAFAERALLAAQVPKDCIPELAQILPLPNGDVTVRTAASTKGSVPSRRAFFSGLTRAVSGGVARKAGSVSPMFDLASAPKQAREAVPYRRGHESRLALTHLARQQSSAPAEAHLARIAISDACRAHASCARLCPTGALISTVEANDSILSFDAWLCIDCGACSTACPNHALAYMAPAWGEFHAGRVELARVRQTECSRCGDRFAASVGSALCDVCTKSAALSQAGFALFTGLRRELPGAAEPP